MTDCDRYLDLARKWRWLSWFALIGSVVQFMNSVVGAVASGVEIRPAQYLTFVTLVVLAILGAHTSRRLAKRG